MTYKSVIKILLLLTITKSAFGSSACDVCICQPTMQSPFLTSCNSNSNLIKVPDNIINTTKIFLANDGKIHNITSEDFKGLNLLETLELTNNSISIIESDAFKDLESLTILKLSSNLLTELSATSLNGLSNVTHLEINDNQITNVPDNICSELEALESLSAQANKISTVGSNTFTGCNSLAHIDISQNGMTTIAEDAFQGLDSLSTIDITGNKLTAFYSAWFTGKPSSINFKMDNNATWSCDLQMKTEYDLINKSHPGLLSCSTDDGFCPLCANFQGIKLVNLVITERTVTVPTTTGNGQTHSGVKTTTPASTTPCNNMTSTCADGAGYRARLDVFLLIAAMALLFYSTD